ncbi:MAG: hypothetical protein FJ221_11035 [Lentisphaerae bacterium]|nr:hypothetical protein [Lentisphaerota bacterium]
MRALAFGLCLALAEAAPLAAGADPKPATLSAAELEKRWRPAASPAGRFSTREFYALALEAAAADWHPGRVETLLAHGAAKQDRDPKSKTFGNLAWYWEDPVPVDRNCVQFCMQRGALLWILFRDRLTPKARAMLEETMRFAVEGIRLHKVPPSYSNIYLKKAWTSLAIGENAGRPDLAAEGRAMLDLWLAHTRTNGVCEYLSPTYYAVNMENAGLIARHARDPETRRRGALAMEFLWTEVAAHWFAPAGRLGGPHSRDYDYLRGIGGLRAWTERAGWPSASDPSRERQFIDDACWVAPPPSLADLVTRAPRMVRGRFGADGGRTIAQWVGRRVALGTAGAAYADSMDKTFVVLFPGHERPTASFLMDARLDPYGQKKYPTGGGHNKAHHVFPFLASVQRGAEALLLASATTEGRSQAFRRSGTNLTCMLSHWALPADLPLHVGATGAAVAGKGTLRLPATDTPVFLRSGDAAAGFRFVWGTTPAGGAPPVEVVEDGAKWKVRRMTCVHSTAPPAGRTAVAVWARAAEGLDDAGFAAFREAFARAKASVLVEGDTVDVVAPGLAGPLRVKADLAKEERLALEGAEDGADAALLTVDGREIGAPILDRAAVR